MHAAVPEMIFLILIGFRDLMAPWTNIHVTHYCIVEFTVLKLSIRYSIEERKRVAL